MANKVLGKAMPACECVSLIWSLMYDAITNRTQPNRIERPTETTKARRRRRRRRQGRKLLDVYSGKRYYTQRVRASVVCRWLYLDGI